MAATRSNSHGTTAAPALVTRSLAVAWPAPVDGALAWLLSEGPLYLPMAATGNRRAAAFSFFPGRVALTSFETLCQLREPFG